MFVVFVLTADGNYWKQRDWGKARGWRKSRRREKILLVREAGRGYAMQERVVEQLIRQRGALRVMGIFISYRRADSNKDVSRIYDHLIKYFPKESIFRDIDSLKIGKPFPQMLQEAIASARVVLVVIGPNWISVTDSNTGLRRLDDPSDYVRREVEQALASDKDVVPIFLSKECIPSEQAIRTLPRSIQALFLQNGLQVREDPDFHRDMERLVARLSEVVGLERRKNAARTGSRHTPRAGSVPAQMIELLSDFWYKRKDKKQSLAARKALAKAFPSEFGEWGQDKFEWRYYHLAAIILNSKYEFSGDILDECQAVCEERAEQLARQGYLQDALDFISSLPAEHQRPELLARYSQRKDQLQQNYKRICSALDDEDDDELEEAAAERVQLVPDEEFAKRFARNWAFLMIAYQNLNDFPKNKISELQRMIGILRSGIRSVITAMGCGCLLLLAGVMIMFWINSNIAPQSILGWTPEDRREEYRWYFHYSAITTGVVATSITVLYLWLTWRKMKTRKMLLTQRPYSRVFRNLIVNNNLALVLVLDAVEFRHG